MQKGIDSITAFPVELANNTHCMICDKLLSIHKKHFVVPSKPTPIVVSICHKCTKQAK